MDAELGFIDALCVRDDPACVKIDKLFFDDGFLIKVGGYDRLGAPILFEEKVCCRAIRFVEKAQAE